MAENLQTLLVRLDADVERLRRAMKQGEESVSNFDRNVERKLSNVDKRFEKLNKSAAFLGKKLAAFFAARALLGVLRTVDNFNVLQDRIKSATRATGDFKQVYNSLLETSLKTGSSLNNSVELFQRLAFTSKSLGASNKDMIKLNDIIQKLGVISGSTREQMKNGTLQLSQALGEGIFRAQEFNSVLENMPAVLNAIARGTGKSVSELRKLVKSGQFLSRTAFDAILSQGDIVEKQFSEIPSRVGRSWSKVTTAITARLSSIDKAMKKTILSTSGLAQSLEGWADLIAPPDGVEKAQALHKKLADINKEIEHLLDITSGEHPIARLFAGDILSDKSFLEKLEKLKAEREKITEVLSKQIDFNSGLPSESGNAPPPPPPRATPDSIQPLFNADVTDMRGGRKTDAANTAKQNADETRSILNDLEIDVLRASGNVAEAIRREGNAEIMDWQKRVEAGTASEEDLARARILINERVSGKIAEIAKNDMARMSEAAAEFGNAMAAAFESRGIDAILNGDLSGALKGIIKDFAAMALRLYVLKPLAESLFKSQGGGSGIFSGLTSALSNIFGKAGGGDISQPTLVGERGPELFIPKTAGTIKNASDTKRLGGGQPSIVQNISMSTDVKNTVRAEIAQSVPMIANAVSQIMRQQFAGVRA